MSSLFALLAAFAASVAPPLVGDVRDSVARTPLAQVIVLDLRSRQQTITDGTGRFELPVAAPTRLRFSRAGYATREVEVTSPAILAIALAPSPRSLEAVSVTAFRGGANTDAAPISQHTLS